MKKLFVLAFMTILFAACSKEDDPNGNKTTEKKNNIEKAIDSITNKETAKDITITGELSDSEWELLKNIRKQLPAVENITLSDVAVIKDGVFAYQDGIAWQTNDWLKSINAPNVKVINNRAFMFCEELHTVKTPNATTIGKEVFRACESLISISFPKATSIADECFVGCEKLESIELPLIEVLSDELFWGCRSLTSIELPKVNVINSNPFRGCENLKTIKFGSINEIKVTLLSFESSFDTKKVTLDLTGVEATQAIGNIWKDYTWKGITNSGEPLKSADFGIANFGSTMDFVSKHETRRTISGAKSKQLIYANSSNDWYIYNFDDNKKLISGTLDCSIQFGGTPTDLIFLPINSYITEINMLKKKFGEPNHASEDVLAFNLTDKKFEPSYAYYESQIIMNRGKTITYKFSNSTTNVESVLSAYTRYGQTQIWGFTIKTTYSQK